MAMKSLEASTSARNCWSSAPVARNPRSVARTVVTSLAIQAVPRLAPVSAWASAKTSTFRINSRPEVGTTRSPDQRPVDSTVPRMSVILSSPT
jgi:hypothetical protein